MKSRVGAIAQLLFVDLVGSILWFPVWWYTRGLQRVIDLAYATIVYRIRAYAFGVWIRNFFVPMYGLHDWTSRLISVFMRLVVLIGRCIGLLVEIIVYAIGIAAWIILPPAALILAIQGGVLSVIRDRTSSL
jgi:hypothetical protein